MESNGHTSASAEVRRKHEFALCLHVFEHAAQGSAPRYTIGVWDNSLQPPGLRAICHAQPIYEAAKAVTREIGASEERKDDHARSPQWAVLCRLIERLRKRNDSDSNGAADEIAELYSRLHNTTGDLEDARDRLKRLGCLVEELAAKGEVLPGENNRYYSVLVPEPAWSKFLAAYRSKQEGWQIYCELRRLRELAAITADTLRTVENWLGNAGTREGAMDSLWRLTRILQDLGYELPMENLKWRGELTRALEEAGLGMGADGLIRVRQPQDKYWEPATGPDVKSILQDAVPANGCNSRNLQEAVNHE